MMRPSLIVVVGFLLAAGMLNATVVRLAPDFSWEGTGGRPHPLKQLRGQPVVLLIAPAPEDKAFRREVSHLEDKYLDFSSKKTVFIVAFTRQVGRVNSNIPFVNAQNPAAIAAAYGAKEGAVNTEIIGVDGNLDMQSNRGEPSQQILDVINNNFSAQAAARTGQ